MTRENLKYDIETVQMIPSLYPSIKEQDEQAIINVIEYASEQQRLEKQGLLLKLPCKVGDTIYAIGVLGDFENVEECKVVNVQYHVSNLQTVFRCDAICKKFNMGYGVQFKKTSFGNDFGRIVFLTEQEAQSALEKMKGE